MTHNSVADSYTGSAQLMLGLFYFNPFHFNPVRQPPPTPSRLRRHILATGRLLF